MGKFIFSGKRLVRPTNKNPNESEKRTVKNNPLEKIFIAELSIAKRTNNSKKKNEHEKNKTNKILFQKVKTNNPFILI